MASGFTYKRAQQMLMQNIKPETWVGLSSTTPTKEGGNFTELNTNYGYTRAQFGQVNANKDGQITNDKIIFFFVATGDCGSATHLGFFDSEAGSAPPFLVAQLESPLTIAENYVPLIREHKLIIGLDVDALDTNY